MSSPVRWALADASPLNRLTGIGERRFQPAGVAACQGGPTGRRRRAALEQEVGRERRTRVSRGRASTFGGKVSLAETALRHRRLPSDFPHETGDTA